MMAPTGAPGEIGGIQVAGAKRVRRLLAHAREDEAEEFTADGFFKTGDVGKHDTRAT
jgi:non-ribosomal peptide synthetase component E (peptide arylation enzyme)